MIRPARPSDAPDIHRLVRELADYERSADQVAATEDDLRRALFGEQPAVFALIAEHEGSAAGFALWFLSYSTCDAQQAPDMLCVQCAATLARATAYLDLGRELGLEVPRE